MYFVSLRGCQQTLRVFIDGNDMITSKSSKQVLVFAALCHHRYKNRRNLWSWFTVLACAPSSVITTKRSLGWWTSVATTSICIDQKGVKQLTTQTVRGTKSILKVYRCLLVYNRKKMAPKWLEGHSLASALSRNWILPSLLTSSWDFTWLNHDKTAAEEVDSTWTSNAASMGTWWMNITAARDHKMMFKSTVKASQRDHQFSPKIHSLKATRRLPHVVRGCWF